MEKIVKERIAKKVDEILALYADGDVSLRDIWDTAMKAMELAQELDAPDFKGEQKKEVAREVLSQVLAKTDSWGPDVIVDPALLAGFDIAFDYLIKAAKGDYKID